VTSPLELGDRDGTSGADAAGLLNEACAAGLTCRKTSMRTRWIDRRGCLLDQVADEAAQAGVFAGERLRLGAAVDTLNSMAAASPPSWTNTANMNGDFTAAAWAFLKSLRHRETMTVFLETPAQTPTDAGPDGPHAGRRRIALGAIIALAGGCSLVLLNAIDLGPAWVHGAASLVALTAALAVLVVGELGWQQTVATAQAAGLVARYADGSP